jgi:hypothetical protein
MAVSRRTFVEQALATAAAAFANDFTTFLIARAAVGVGEAAYATLAPSIAKYGACRAWVRMSCLSMPSRSRPPTNWYARLLRLAACRWSTLQLVVSQPLPMLP